MAAAAWWAGTRIRSPAEVAAQAQAPSPSVITAKVELRPLMPAVVTRGTVTAQRPTDIDVTQAAGAARLIVTSAPVRIGASVREGAVVLEVSGRPVFALGGELPMYRDLVAGDAGRDVTQLQASLSRLGYGSGRSGVLDQRTEAAVARMYQRAGYRSLGPAGHAVVPMAEIAFVPTLPATVVRAAPGVGSDVNPDGPELTIAGALEVVTRLSTSETQAVSVGSAATIQASTLGHPVQATVVRIAEQVSADEAGGVEGHLTELTPKEPIDPTLLGQDVEVTIRASAAAASSLIVPLSAVSSAPDGSVGVTRVGSKGELARVPVRLGPSSGGFVAVTPLRGRLRAGDRVVVGG